MAAIAGRLFVLKKNSVVVGGGISLNVTVGAEPIDITNKDSDGHITYLDDTLTGRQVVYSVEGVDTDGVLRALAFASAASSVFLSDLSFEFGATATVTGDFVMTGYTAAGDDGGSITYTATFSSSGAVVYT